METCAGDTSLTRQDLPSFVTSPILSFRVLKKEREQGICHVYIDLPSPGAVGRTFCKKGSVFYNLLVLFSSLPELRFINFRIWQRAFLCLCKMKQMGSPVDIHLGWFIL